MVNKKRLLTFIALIKNMFDDKCGPINCSHKDIFFVMVGDDRADVLGGRECHENLLKKLI